MTRDDEEERNTRIKKLSRMGKRHALAGGENQDALRGGQDRRLCVISLADGVSGCREARRGAEIAGEAITELFLKKGEHFLEFSDAQVGDFALAHILAELRQAAAEADLPLEEYSSTVASVLVDKRTRRMLCFNLGDGMILAAEGGKCRVLSMPADSTSGCCVTTTGRAGELVSVRRFVLEGMESVVILSDGAWRELFSRARLRPEAAAMIAAGDYDALGEYLIRRECMDDFSFITADMRQNNGREPV